MEQSPVHGVNQQERLLCWLGGIVDGEGCITINHHRLHKQTKKETLLFTPIIIIVNTDKVLIDQCCQILFDLDLPFHLQSYSKEQKEKSPSANGRARKASWMLRIVGLRRVAKALNVIGPYILTKTSETKLVKHFCDKRIKLEKVRYKYYDDEDFDIIEKVARIHNRNPQRLHAEILEYKTSRNMI
jgi:hypothetical protein